MKTQQRCPGCNRELSQEEYYPSCWGIQGQPCRDCQNKRAAKWRKKNPDKIKKWRQKQGRLYTQNSHLLNRYGISQEEYYAMMARQKNRCLGCQESFIGKAVVDHDHRTGRVRGILCRQCNWALGQTKENPLTLRRLIAYIEVDRRKVMLYITGALKNPRVPEIGNLLRAEGFDAFDEWFTPGPRADWFLHQYSTQRGLSHKEALEGRAVTNIHLFDRAYLDLADAVIIVMPAGKSSMIEAGYAIGSDKPVYLLLDGNDPKRFDVMPAMFTKIVGTEIELVEALKEDVPLILQGTLKGILQ